MDSIVTIEFFILLGISVCLWLWIASRRILGWKLGRVAIDQGTADSSKVSFPPVGLVDVFVMLMVWIAAQMIGVSIWAIRNGIDANDLNFSDLDADQTAHLMLISKGVLFGFVILVSGYLIWRYRRESPLRTNGKLWSDVFVGLVASVLFIPPVLGVHLLVNYMSQVEYNHATIDSIEKSQSVFPLLVGWLGTVLIAPFAEELFCRGLIQSWLLRLKTNLRPEQIDAVLVGGWPEDRTGDEAKAIKKKLSQSSGGDAEIVMSPNWIVRLIAIVGSAGFFALLHFGQGLAPIPLFLLSAALGYLYDLRKSLVPCIVVHALLNTHTMVWLTLNFYFGQTELQ